MQKFRWGLQSETLFQLQQLKKKNQEQKKEKSCDFQLNEDYFF